ncbi:MAG: thiosulfate oxidation carrier complex protein SoxZ [Gammaproteobacteria bacterium]|nr:thiosulfate oxidation carrier complex protein SoxZ [Gammaproteobacteria bacterium]
MSAKPIQIRAKHTKGVTTVRALIKHQMSNSKSSPINKNKGSNPHFIQEVTCSLGDNIILSALWGSDIAKDPFLAFTFKGGNKGETIRLSWVDNMGKRDSIETIVA